MAKGDMPNEQQLRTIAAASQDDQKEVWKAQKPKKESTRTRALLKWGPLMLSGLLVLGGGAALGISTLGHEEDRATVARLVKEREARSGSIMQQRAQPN